MCVIFEKDIDMNIDEFRIKHSDVIRFCQIIEGDLKWIYALMLKGNPGGNYGKVENFTLGQIVSQLKKLDKSAGEQYLSDSDYDYLKEVTEKRNYWCHFCYREFIYVDNWINSGEYVKVCKDLQGDWEKLSGVYKSVESAKIRANDCYGRAKRIGTQT